MNNLNEDHEDFDLAAENERLAEDYSRRTISERISEDRDALAEASQGEKLFTDAFSNRLRSIVDSLYRLSETNQYLQQVRSIIDKHQKAFDKWNSLTSKYSYTSDVPTEKLKRAIEAYEKLLNALEKIDGIESKVKEVDKIRQETQQLAESQINEIAERANSASPKVKARVLKNFMPNSGGRTPDLISHDLFSMQNDFYNMLRGGSMEDVRDEYYSGWTDDDIRELYKVLYGEEMD